MKRLICWTLTARGGIQAKKKRAKSPLAREVPKDVDEDIK
jgi:hypothetical protein